MQLFQHYILFGKDLLVKLTHSFPMHPFTTWGIEKESIGYECVKETLYSACLNLNHGNENSNQKCESWTMIGFIKPFDQYNQKLNFTVKRVDMVRDDQFHFQNVQN